MERLEITHGDLKYAFDDMLQEKRMSLRRSKTEMLLGMIVEHLSSEKRADVEETKWIPHARIDSSKGSEFYPSVRCDPPIQCIQLFTKDEEGNWKLKDRQMGTGSDKILKDHKILVGKPEQEEKEAVDVRVSIGEGDDVQHLYYHSLPF